MSRTFKQFFRVNEAEDKAIKAAAHKAGHISVGAWVRHVVLKACGKAGE